MDKDDILKSIETADATGLVADEAFIAEVETRPVLPHEDLHAALPEGHPAHATIDELHAELGKPSPSLDAIQRHAGTLRSVPQIEARLANWWDAPGTQRFILYLTQIGL